MCCDCVEAFCQALVIEELVAVPVKHAPSASRSFQSISAAFSPLKRVFEEKFIDV
jgi:hypothetical protein